MEKILLAIDAVNLNMPAIDFACFIARLTQSKLTGVFLENLVADEKPVLKKTYGSPTLDWELDESSSAFRDKRELIEKNITSFRKACENRSVACQIHRDRGMPSNEIISESRYADLIIVDPSTSFTRKYQGAPSRFIKDVLKDAECPVLVAPETFEGIDEIIFTYDGSKSAAFAIKQFTYLFPQLDDKKTIILQVNKEGEWAGADKHNLREWLQNHYSAIGFDALKGNTEDKLFDYLLNRKNTLIVMGTYGRNSLSRFFKPSRADLLIQTISQPIFISHY